MSRSITWPTRSEWQAKAEHHVRTSCHTWQRVSPRPDEWLTSNELAEARTLAAAVVKATRTALTRAGRSSERPDLNEHGRNAARTWANVNDLHLAWKRIISTANSVGAAPQQAERLAELNTTMVTRRDSAAKADEDDEVAREVAKRATDAGWAAELTRRARIERGPMLTNITVYADGTQSVSDATPYQGPGLR